MYVFIECVFIFFSLIGMFVCSFRGVNDLQIEAVGFATLNFAACLLLLLNAFAKTLQLFEKLNFISYK